MSAGLSFKIIGYLPAASYPARQKALTQHGW
jgi:hypothetical protein